MSPRAGLAGLAALAVLSFAASATELALPPPGTAAGDIPALERFACETHGRDRRCRLEARSGMPMFEGIPTVAMLVRLRDDGVVSGTAWFAETHFESVTSSLTARFGPPEERPESLRAGMGATFTNAVLIWRHPDGSAWLAEQFSGGIDTASVTRMTGSALAAWLREREAETANGTRNLRSGYD